jgi:hypothetical protein
MGGSIEAGCRNEVSGKLWQVVFGAVMMWTRVISIQLEAGEPISELVE